MIDYVSNIHMYIYDFMYIFLHFMMINGKKWHNKRIMGIWKMKIKLFYFQFALWDSSDHSKKAYMPKAYMKIKAIFFKKNGKYNIKYNIKLSAMRLYVFICCILFLHLWSQVNFY